MKFVFTHVDGHHWSREHAVVVNVSHKEYQVTECQPELPSMPLMVIKLNGTRDFFGFLKQVRAAFAAGCDL